MLNFVVIPKFQNGLVNVAIKAMLNLFLLVENYKIGNGEILRISSVKKSRACMCKEE